MKFKKLYVAKNCERDVTGLFTSLDKLVEAYSFANLNVLELEEIDFSDGEKEINWDLFVSLVEVNPVFE